MGDPGGRNGAAVVVTGSELLTGNVADRNGPFLARRLAALGVPCRTITAVGDDPGALMAAVALARREARLVIVTGGLGPTHDDRTRKAIADVVERPLVEPDTLPGHRPGAVPEGAVQIANPKGSAAGFWLEAPPGWVAALPGVPWEMRAMWEGLADHVRRCFPDAEPGALLTLRTVGLTEREVERRLRPVEGEIEAAGAVLGVTALPLQVDVHLAATTADATARAATAVRRALGDVVYGEGEVRLAEVVGHGLKAAGRRIATAESCTGGALCAALTAVPGASNWVERAVVAYANAAKVEVLGVDPALIEAHGAVSAPVARAMAEGLLARAPVHLALAVTGIAGPTGGTPDKPVGLVYLALAEARGTFCRAFRHPGDRTRFTRRTVARALDLVRLHTAGGLDFLAARFPEREAK